MSRKKEYETANKIKVVIYAIGIALTMLIIIFAVSYNRKMEIAKREVAETVRVDLETYLSTLTNDYKTEVIKELAKDDVIDEITYLSTDQIDSIVGEISKLVKERLMNEAVSTSFSEDQLVQIENDIVKRVEQSLGERLTDMTSSEKDSLMTSLTTIAETNVLNKLRQEFYNMDENIQILSNKVEKNVTNLQKSLEKQGDNIVVMQDRIKELESTLATLQNGTSTDFKDLSAELMQLEEDHAELLRSYNASQLVALNTSDIVTNLISEPTNEDGVVSASAGHVMKTDISNIQNRLMELDTYLANNFNGLDANLDRLARLTDQKLGELSESTSSALQNAKDALQSAIDGNSTDITQLTDALEQAKQALTNDLNSLDSKTANALQESEQRASEALSASEKRASDALSASEQRTSEALSASEKKASDALSASEQRTSEALSASEKKAADALSASEKKLSDTIQQVKEELESRPVVTYEFKTQDATTTCVVTVPKE